MKKPMWLKHYRCKNNNSNESEEVKLTIWNL